MRIIQKGLCCIKRVVAPILFNSYIIGATLAGISYLIVVPRVIAGEMETSLIQIIDTSIYPSPDPGGIAYFPSQDTFLITDSEINEMEIFQGVNVFETDRYGSLLETFSATSFSIEPTGVTINLDNSHCFFSDDNSRLINEIDPGSDGLCLTDDDTVTSFATDDNFGSSDPEGVTYGLNSLFIVDGANKRVYRVMPDSNGVFKSVTKNNLENSFDTESLGVTDPEGIVFNSINNTLFIVGYEQSIIQTTTYGVLLNTIDISTINPTKPAGLALAPGSEDPTITNLYMVARGEDNDNTPGENDGKVYELTIPSTTQGNATPEVSVGEDQVITLLENALLNGSVSDDGIPSNTLTTTWSKYSGPGDVYFADPDSLNTTASFSMAGTYVLRLTVYDGELYSFDDQSVNIPGEGGGGSTDETILLVALAFLFRHRIKKVIS